jgi:hypothetical protein
VELLPQVAEMIGTRVRIPSTKAIGNLTVAIGDTSTNVLTTVTNFSASYIVSVRNVTESTDLTIYPTLELLFADYEDFDEAGPIEAVCFEDFMAWTQKVATVAQVLSFIYYRTPTVPTTGADTIQWAPTGLHHDLFVHGIA